MDVFDYAAFNEQFTILNNIIGEGETDSSTINGVIENCNRAILDGLSSAEDSDWARIKMEEWNNLMPSLVSSLNNLNVLLQNAKAAAEAYNQFEQSHNNNNFYETL